MASCAGPQAACVRARSATFDDGLCTEYAGKDRIDVLGVITVIEQRLEVGVGPLLEQEGRPQGLVDGIR